MVKYVSALISLRKLTGEEKSLGEVCVNGMGAREPPMAPEPLATELADGVLQYFTRPVSDAYV